MLQHRMTCDLQCDSIFFPIIALALASGNSQYLLDSIWLSRAISLRLFYFVFLCSNPLLHLFLCLIHFLPVLSLSLSHTEASNDVLWQEITGQRPVYLLTEVGPDSSPLVSSASLKGFH